MRRQSYWVIVLKTDRGVFTKFIDVCPTNIDRDQKWLENIKKRVNQIWKNKPFDFSIKRFTQTSITEMCRELNYRHNTRLRISNKLRNKNILSDLILMII